MEIRSTTPLRELAQDIRRLMSLAYPGEEKTELGQLLARDAFLAALNDTSLQIQIRKKSRRSCQTSPENGNAKDVAEDATSARYRLARKIEEYETALPPVNLDALPPQ